MWVVGELNLHLGVCRERSAVNYQTETPAIRYDMKGMSGERHLQINPPVVHRQTILTWFFFTVSCEDMCKLKMTKHFVLLSHRPQ